MLVRMWSDWITHMLLVEIANDGATRKTVGYLLIK